MWNARCIRLRVTAAVPSIPLSALLSLFTPTVSIPRKAAARPVSEAGTAGGSTAPSTGNIAFQFLLGSPSGPADGLPQPLPAKVQGTQWPASVPQAEPGGSGPSEPVVAVEPHSPTFPAIRTEAETASFSTGHQPARSRLAAGVAQPVVPPRIPVVAPGSDIADNFADSGPVSSSVSPASVTTRQEPADCRLTARQAQPVDPRRVPGGTEVVGNPAVLSHLAFPSASSAPSEPAVAPASIRQLPAGSGSTTGNRWSVAPRLTIRDLAVEGADEPPVSSRIAFSSGYADGPEWKGSLRTPSGVVAEARNSGHKVATDARTPGQTEHPKPQNRTSIKPAAARDNSGPENKARSVGSPSRRDGPQRSSGQSASAAGEPPGLTPQGVVLQPTGVLDLGVYSDAAPPILLASQAPDPGTTSTNSVRILRPADRQNSRDPVATQFDFRTAIAPNQSMSGIPLGSRPATAAEPPAARPEAGALPPPSHTPSESRSGGGEDPSTASGQQRAAALRTGNSGESERAAGPQFSPVSWAAPSAPLAFHMTLTTPVSTSVVSSAVVAGPSAPAPSPNRVALHQEDYPPSAGTPVSDKPVGANSGGGQMPEPGAERGAAIGDAKATNRPETASSSRGASRTEPTETAAATVAALTNEGGNALFAASSAQPPLRPTAQPIAADSPTPPQPAETFLPAAPAATPVNREIQLQVGSGPSGVAVRVAERAGEIRVDVRTPDSQLTSTLRQELPTLAARLTESGFNAAIWHPGYASATAFSRDATETGAPANADDQGGQGQEQPQQSGHQPPDERPRQSFPSQQPNTNREDFRWLFTSLQ